MIKHDFHLHTNNSNDSDTPMAQMIERGIELGLSAMCFTEHMDMDFPRTETDTPSFEVDTDTYHAELCTLKEKYRKQINILFGVELGLQPQLVQRHKDYVDRYPFDFIIGSSHVAEGLDPFYPPYYEGRTEDEAYQAYFEDELNNIRLFNTYDIYGHLDYIVRYGPNKNQFYTYQKFSDIIDEILRELISRGKGIEVNTGGLKYGLGHPNPTEDIIKRYRELGGEIITIGSDAHIPQYVAYEFARVESILQQSGFRYYTVFENRKAEFIKF